MRRGERRAALEAALNRCWYPTQETPAPALWRVVLGLLTPLEWVFRALVAGRRLAYRRGWWRRHRIDVPVIVVGNLSVGGTGKTPLTLYLARALRDDLDLRVGIVTRGYASTRGRRAAPVRVTADSRAEEVGDEALVLASAPGVAIVAGRDRVRGAKLLAPEVDVILADDGLQHLRLARDLELVLVDCERGLGNGRLLPCGPLREAPGRLANADVLVLSGAGRDHSPPADLGASSDSLPISLRTRPLPTQVLWTRARVQTAVRVASPSSTRALESFATAPVHALAGIADPGRFFRALRAHGLEVIEHPLADHAALSPEQVTFDDDLMVLMTEKDAVKCRQFAHARCWAVRLEVEMTPSARRSLVQSVHQLCCKEP